MGMNRTGLGLVFVLIACVSEAGATTVAHRSEEERVSLASAIVRAKVLAVKPRWYGDNLIVTDVFFESVRVLKWDKGFKPESRVFRMVQLGGKMGTRELVVPGTSRYTAGEEVLVFLETGAGDWVEMGVGSGRFLVDRAGDVPLIVRDSGGAAAVLVVGKRAGPRAWTPAPLPERLDAFEQRILIHLNK